MTTRTLGRNEPCWCGSGKKYKHCHYQEDRDNEMRALREAAAPVDFEPEPVPAAVPSEPVDFAARGVMIGIGATLAASLGLWIAGQGSIAAAVLGVGLFAVLVWGAVRKPPPPRTDDQNPAAIGFGTDTRSNS